MRRDRDSDRGTTQAKAQMRIWLYCKLVAPTPMIYSTAVYHAESIQKLFQVHSIHNILASVSVSYAKRCRRRKRTDSGVFLRYIELIRGRVLYTYRQP